MGYEVNRFVECFNLDDFKCGICLDVLHEPRMVRNCEHIYCKECLSDWLASTSSCPEDRKPVEWTDVVEPSRFFRNQYERLKIKCDFADTGCKKVLTIGALEEHVVSCYHNRAECSSHCGFGGTRDDLRSHDCVRYLKAQLAIAKRPATEAESIKGARDKIWELLQTLNNNYDLIWDQFQKLSAVEDFKPTPLLQYRFDQGFTESDKETIGRIVVVSLFEGGNSFFVISSRIQKTLIKQMPQEKYWHVLVGTAFSCYVKYRKYMAFSVAGIQVIVFVNENWQLA